MSGSRVQLICKWRGTTEEMVVEERRDNQEVTEVLQLPRNTKEIEDYQGMASSSVGTSTGHRQKTSLITLLGLSRQKNLEPQQKKLYNIIAALKKATCRLRKRNIDLQGRLQEFKQMISTGNIDVLQTLSTTAQEFIISNFRNAKCNKFRHIFTLEDKAFALAMYKKSPKNYIFMRNIFCLPSKETLRKVVQQIPVTPGICNSMFDDIEKRVLNFNDVKFKYCILIFDEMKLSPSFHYNAPSDLVYGFVDEGHCRQNEIADHVLVWFLKGVHGDRPWKQPIAFTFSNGATSWEKIVYMFKQIVIRAHDVGLEIIASVCDQGGNNSKAIKNLILDSKRDAFHRNEIIEDNVIIINGHHIVPLYDVPHLLKCIRNNLLTKDLEFKLKDNVIRTAKWSHIEDAYFIDQSSGASLRTMPKLTDQHVVKNKIKKMKVSCCTQVFSHTVASIMSLMSRSGAKSVCQQRSMPRDGEHTAHLLLFFNNLFDSLNRKSIIPSVNNDEQIQTWNDAISVIETMRFVKKKTTDRANPQVLANWIHTLKGYKLIKNNLKQIGFSKFSIINQDSLENFFSQIRQYAIRNTNPTCSAFVGFYKSLVLNSYMDSNLTGNCELDDTSDYLFNFKCLFFNRTASQDSSSNVVSLPTITVISNGNYEVDKNVIVGIKKIILKKVIISVTCEVCYSNYTSILVDDETFIKCMRAIVFTCGQYLPKISYISKFGAALKAVLDNEIPFQFRNCDHVSKLKLDIINESVTYIIKNYFSVIRRILKGTQQPPVHADDLMQMAHEYVQKHSKQTL